MQANGRAMREPVPDTLRFPDSCAERVLTFGRTVLVLATSLARLSPISLINALSRHLRVLASIAAYERTPPMPIRLYCPVGDGAARERVIL